MSDDQDLSLPATMTVTLAGWRAFKGKYPEFEREFDLDLDPARVGVVRLSMPSDQWDKLEQYHPDAAEFIRAQVFVVPEAERPDGLPELTAYMDEPSDDVVTVAATVDPEAPNTSLVEALTLGELDQLGLHETSPIVPPASELPADETAPLPIVPEREPTAQEIAAELQRRIEIQSREKAAVIAVKAQEILAENAATAATLPPSWITQSGLAWHTDETQTPDIARPGSKARTENIEAALALLVEQFKAAPNEGEARVVGHQAEGLSALLEVAKGEEPESYAGAWRRLTGEERPTGADVVASWDGGNAFYELFSGTSDGKRGRIGCRYHNGDLAILLFDL